MRKALIVGIDYYKFVSKLAGAVNDAESVRAMLERHWDDSPNFEVRFMVGTGSGAAVVKQELRDGASELFSGDGEVALFYFSGHGHLEIAGGYLCDSECRTGNDGVSLSELLVMANKSRFQNKVIIIDSCHSGIAGDHAGYPGLAEISEGVTILTASTAEQYATEENGSGVFTNLLVDALAGAAANLVGDITPGAVYAHIDQSLGAWAQRPVFKTNVKRFVSLRKVRPPMELPDLRRIAEFFPDAGFQFQLDPEYEPERAVDSPNVPAPNPAKNAVFAILQKYNRAGLLVPEGAQHMWHAAMQSKTVRLTALGEHYRSLVVRGRI